MTDERRIYLATISKEERAIRKQLRQYRKRIAGYKFDFKYYKDEDIVLKEIRKKIRYHKYLVEVLRKQLSAPKERTKTTFGVYPYQCPSCKGVLETHCTVHYCMHCGQKLR